MITFLSDDRFSPAGDDRVFHAFFGRSGGVSTGLYASLNCGHGTADAPVNIAENRARVARALGVPAARLSGLKQVHGKTCLTIRDTLAERPEADALVTDKPGLALCILTADCGPVLLAGKKTDGSPVIGAAHAGWGGAFGGILESTVDAMVECGATRGSMRAVIGPCIGPASYEVGMDFMAPFLNADPAYERFFRAARTEDRRMFDLPAFIAHRLTAAGVEKVWTTGIDTYPEGNGYFSYRRATHRAEGDYGRQISALVIR